MTTLRFGLLTSLLIACVVAPSAAANRAPARVTAQALLPFVPRTMIGIRAETRRVVDDYGVHAAYRTPTGYINIQLAITRDVGFDRAQLAGIDSDEPERNRAAGVERQGVAIGRFRALVVRYESGLKTDLKMFLGDRINVDVSREGSIPTAEVVALAEALDLEGLERLARRIPAPVPLPD